MMGLVWSSLAAAGGPPAGRPFRTGLVWLNLYAALLHGAPGTLSRPRVRLVVERITGAVLVGFGLRVAAQQG
jgi:threonine/homoserine/homoserine lactone efflux protein